MTAGDAPLVLHTCASAAQLARAREAAPNLRHGTMHVPTKLTDVDPLDGPYALDNGAYAAWRDDEPPTPPRDYWRRLRQVAERDPAPAFVVLPDVPGSADTVEHAAYYLDNVAPHDVPYYLAVHEGASPDWQVRVADRMGCEGVFLGGPLSWKRAAAEETVAAAHARGLGVHVGRPESAAAWFFEVGVDSVDTGGFVRNSDWDRLARLDHAVTTRETEQATLGAVAGEAVA